MGKEIERKFLVKSDVYKSLAQGTHYHQGYIPTVNGMTVRIRIAGEKAQQMLDLMCAKPQIEKYRYVVPASTPEGDKGLCWEVDEFLGDNQGLTIAEIEVPAEDTVFDIPEWVGEEVTGDKCYYNSNLCKFPYKEWKNNN